MSDRSSPPERTVQILVEGRVQGVGFRAFVEREAMALGLVGWVRNRRTAAVEAVLAGPSSAIDRALTRIATGPAASRVDMLKVTADVQDASLGTHDGFRGAADRLSAASTPP